MPINNSEVKGDLHRRLKRIEGQVRGVQHMLDDDRDCRAILQQLSAIRAAVQQASLLLVRAHATECLLNPAPGMSTEKLVDELVDALSGLPMTTAVAAGSLIPA